LHTVKQIVGARANQEDSCLAVTLEPGDATVEPPSTLYIVADGMGGHEAGEIASRCAVQGFRESIEIQQRDGQIELVAAIHHANHRIRESVRSTPALRGMGTTLAAALLKGRRVSWISVGDSPFLLYRAGELHRLNQDHSMLPLLLEQARATGLGDEYAYRNPRRHQLRSSLAGREIGLIDQGSVDAMDEDIFILASDGVDTLSKEAIENLLVASRHQPLDQISESLIAEIERLAVPHQDNTTLVLFTL
jgi:serine/threonine protein phosphatase PrpC